MDFTSFMMLFQFLFSFLLLFVAMPSLVIQFESGDDSLFDRLFIPLIHSSVFVIVAVHVLVLLHLFETLSILGVSIVGFIYLWRRKYAADFNAYKERFVVGVFDELESRKSLKQRWGHTVVVLRQTVRVQKEQVVALMMKSPLSAVLVLTVLGYAAYIRFGHAFTHYYFGASDPYYHMKWTKFVMKNTLFVDGVYSYGFESVMAALARFYFIDLYNVIRYIGPLAGVLIVLSIGYAVRKMGANLYGVFFAMFIYSVLGILPAYTWRQLSALPMEYAAIFFLPGVAFWVLFCRYGNRKHLLLASECLLLTLLIHPFATICLAASIAGTGLWYLNRIFRRKDFWRAVAYIGTGGLLGVLPLGIGLASGIPFYSDSLGYIKNNIKAGTEQVNLLQQKLAEWFTPQATMVYVGIAIITLLCLALNWIRRRSFNQHEVGLLPIFLLTALFFFMYKADVFGLPILIPLDRFGVFFAPFAAMTGGIAILAIGRVADLGLKRAYISGALSILVALGIAVSDKSVYSVSQNKEWPPVGVQYQYDEAAKSYLRIRDNFESGNWTIVSPVEEYPMVEAFGYHENLWKFVSGVIPESTEEVGYPTGNVFFFLETVPLHEEAPNKTYGPIQPSDALEPFPGPVTGDLTTFYYRSKNRIILEAKLKNWLEWYIKRYPDKLSLYIDTPNFKVYQLRQTAQIPPETLPKLPKEYEGKW